MREIQEMNLDPLRWASGEKRTPGDRERNSELQSQLGAESSEGNRDGLRCIYKGGCERERERRASPGPCVPRGGRLSF